VLKRAAKNKLKSKKVITLLLDQRSAKVQITTKVIKAAARNKSSNKEIIALLLN
jgi:hypothetical protein